MLKNYKRETLNALNYIHFVSIRMIADDCRDWMVILCEHYSLDTLSTRSKQ